MVGLFFTVIGMETAFRTLGQNGITDPKTLAASVGYGLISTEIGIMIAIFGLPLIIGSLVLHFAGKRNKARA